MAIGELIKDYNDKIDVLYKEFFRIIGEYMKHYYLKDSLIFLKYNNEILKNENKEYIISLIDDYEEQLYKIYNYEKYLDAFQFIKDVALNWDQSTTKSRDVLDHQQLCCYYNLNS